MYVICSLPPLLTINSKLEYNACQLIYLTHNPSILVFITINYAFFCFFRPVGVANGSSSDELEDGDLSCPPFASN
jgi:hypothetical protein